MEWRKRAGIFLAVWMLQKCSSQDKLLDFFNGQGTCSDIHNFTTNETLTPAQASQAKIVPTLVGTYLVIYPEVAVSSAPTTSR